MSIAHPRRTARACTRFSSAALAALVFCVACDSTSPPKATSIVLVGGATLGIVGQPIDPPLSIDIRDERGNRMGGVAFTAVVASGGGTLSGTPQRTNNNAVTPVGTWTLGTGAGPQSVRIETQGVTPLVVTVTAQAGPPALTAPGAGPLTASGIVGTASVIQPSIIVNDAFGNPASGVAISVTVSGGGFVTNPNPTTNANGFASAGTWMLGTVAGEQTVRLSAGAAAPVVTFRTIAAPGAAVGAVANAPTVTNADVGAIAPVQPSIRVVDQFGNGIAGIAVTATASPGSTVANPNPVTNAAGVASAGQWTIGPTPGQYTVTMAAAGLSPVVFTATATAARFNIALRYVGAAPSAAIQNALNAAAARIEQIVTQDLPDIPVNNLNYATVCQVPGAPVLSEVIDDLLIFAVIGPIDGPGNILGQAGPCILRSATGLPLIGDMIFDDADLVAMVANGTIGDVMLHEMLHVLGIGTLWGPPPNSGVFNLVTGYGGPDPQYTGANARTAYTASGGPPGNPPVPVENTGGAGTRDAHWRESRLGRELMTGYILGINNPLSIISVGALTDFGYGTNPAAADPYVVAPGPGPAAIRAGAEVPVMDAVRLPIFSIDGLGRLARIGSSRD